MVSSTAEVVRTVLKLIAALLLFLSLLTAIVTTSDHRNCSDEGSSLMGCESKAAAEIARQQTAESLTETVFGDSVPAKINILDYESYWQGYRILLEVRFANATPPLADTVLDWGECHPVEALQQCAPKDESGWTALSKCNAVLRPEKALHTPFRLPLHPLPEKPGDPVYYSAQELSTNAEHTHYCISVDISG